MSNSKLKVGEVIINKKTGDIGHLVEVNGNVVAGNVLCEQKGSVLFYWDINDTAIPHLVMGTPAYENLLALTDLAFKSILAMAYTDEPLGNDTIEVLCGFLDICANTGIKKEELKIIVSNAVSEDFVPKEMKALARKVSKEFFNEQ